MAASASSAAAEVMRATIAAAGKGVAIFSKSYCPYCRRAKQALLGIGIHPVVVELDLRDDGPAIQAALAEATGQRTVPNVWLDGKHIGGSDDTVSGVERGLFADVLKGSPEELGEATDLKKCGADDGIACKCFSA